MIATLLLALTIHKPNLPEYSVQKLDGLEFAFGLNDLGEVVGSPLNPKIKAGGIWRQGVLSPLTVLSGPEISLDGKVFRNRGGLKGSSFSPVGLNNVGTIVGYYHDPSIASYFTIPGAIYKGQTSSITQTLPPENNADGNGTKLFAVNEKNVAVGSYRGPGYEQMPIIVNLEKGTMQVLSTEIEYYGKAIDINESGLVLGGGDGGFKAYLWKDGRFIQIKANFTHYPGAINDHGVAVGRAETGGTGTTWAWIFENGSVDVLEPFSGGQYGSRTEANDIANNGWIVGASTYGEMPRQRACLWVQRQPFDLEAIVPALRGSYRSRALSINEKGQILAEVGFNEYFLLTPKK